MIKVRPSPDNVLIWFASSEEDPSEEYTVNMLEDSCSCKDFEFRTSKMLRRGVHIKSCGCKHWRAVRNVLADAAIEHLKNLAKQEIERQI